MGHTCMFIMWHHLGRYGTKLDLRILPAYSRIQRIADLGAKRGLLDGADTRGDHERPEDRHSNKADRSDDCFVYPLLLSNHGEYAAWCSLHGDGEGCLHADYCDEISTFAHLYGHMVAVTEVLHLVALAKEGVFEVIGDVLYVDAWVMVESVCHVFSPLILRLASMVFNTGRLRRRKKKSIFGDTPNPGKGLPSSALLLLLPEAAEGEEVGDTPNPGKGLPSSALLLGFMLF